MNERIKKLADKVWSLDMEPNPHFQLCLQSFAESIVQECVGVVNMWSDEQPCSEGYDILTVSKIKQHFGVEEL